MDQIIRIEVKRRDSGNLNSKHIEQLQIGVGKLRDTLGPDLIVTVTSTRELFEIDDEAE